VRGVRKATTGGETVQYRHEKTFYNPTLLAARSAPTSPPRPGSQTQRLECLSVRTRGPEPAPGTGGLKDANGDAGAFAAVAKQIAETSEFNLVLMTEDADV
jgi:acetyl-CoA decarbonylase/synthase complex subunit gamma